MAITLASLTARVVMRAPGLAEPTAEMLLRDAAIEFCAKTLLWQHDAGSDITLIGEGEYLLDIPAQSQMVMPLHVWIDGSELTPIDATQLNALGDWQAMTGQARYYYSDDRAVVRVVPIPDTAGTLTARVAATPSQSASTLPDLLTWHTEPLVNGALARALEIPNQPFTQPSMAAVYAQRFASDIAKARIALSMGNARGAVRVAPASF